MFSISKIRIIRIIKTARPIATAILAGLLIFGPVGMVADSVVIETTTETSSLNRMGTGNSTAIADIAWLAAKDEARPESMIASAAMFNPTPTPATSGTTTPAPTNPSPATTSEAPAPTPTPTQALTPMPKPTPTPTPTSKPTPRPISPTPKPISPTPKPAATATPAPAPTPAPTPKATTGTVSASGIKNVILMIADGWGFNQIMATDYFMSGVAGAQAYERFPVRLSMSTYSLNGSVKTDDQASIYSPLMWNDFTAFKNLPTDSAAAATALSTGVKTYNSAIGMNQDKVALRHITADFESKGKATGVVTSVPISHATPAGFVAHNASRSNYSAIANEMLGNSATDVIMGAGHPLYSDYGRLRSTVLDEYYRFVGGKATWEALIAGTLPTADANGDGKSDPWTLIQTKAAFEALQSGRTPNRLLGIAQVYETLQAGRGGDTQAAAFVVPFNANVPSLKVMARGALNVLDNDPDGFFLMIEGGGIDWTGHSNRSGRLIEEMAEFNAAVNAVSAWVTQYSNWNETLLIVTGDHETGYLTGTIGVYDAVRNNGKGVMPGMAWNSTGHTNQLIPFFAKGKGADLFTGMADKQDTVRGSYLDNTEISKVIRSLLK